MSNTIKTLTAGDITRKALAILHNKLVFTKNINRQYDDRFARSGAKNGGYLEIREPNQFTVRSGAVMDTQDVVEETTQLVLATQKGVDINFSSVELTLSLDDFADRILNPSMARLAAEVDKTNINECIKYVANFENTTFGTAPILTDILQARALINKGLAPDMDRYLMGDAVTATGLMSASSALHNPIDAVSRQYERGLVGELYGFKFYESEMTPTHTNGTRTDTTPTCDMSSMANSSGISYLMMTANAAGTTILPGDVCTLADCYACNPETKDRYAHLQQFSVTATALGTAALTTVNISPKIYTSGAKQNVVLATISTSTTVTWQGAGGSGTASSIRTHNLAWQKDAFTAVFADLHIEPGYPNMHREVYDGISLRYWRSGDIVNDKWPARLDVLFGQKCLKPGWACRICS